jgi:hypothetical protein
MAPRKITEAIKRVRLATTCDEHDMEGEIGNEKGSRFFKRMA